MSLKVMHVGSQVIDLFSEFVLDIQFMKKCLESLKSTQNVEATNAHHGAPFSSLANEDNRDNESEGEDLLTEH